MLQWSMVTLFIATEFYQHSLVSFCEILPWNFNPDGMFAICFHMFDNNNINVNIDVISDFSQILNFLTVYNVSIIQNTKNKHKFA